MRRRPWIIIPIVFSLAIVFCLFILFRYLNQSQWLKYKILSQTSSLPGLIAIERVDLLPSSVRIQGLRFTLADSSASLTISKIYLKYSLLNFLLSKGDPKKLLTGIILVSPSLDLKLKKDHLKTEAQPIPRQRFLKFADDFDPLEKIVIQNGGFVFTDAKGKAWLKTKRIDGLIEKHSLQNVSCYLQMALFEDTSSSITLSGNADLAASRYVLDIDASGYPLNLLTLPESLPLQDLNGSLDLAGRLVYSSNYLTIAGDWGISGGDVQIKGGPHIQSIDCSGSFHDKVIELEGACWLENDYAKLSGRFNFLNESTLTATATISQGDLRHYLIKFAKLDSSEAPKGIICTNATFNWESKSKSWRADAFAIADSLQTPVGVFSNIQVGLGWSKEQPYLRFKSIDGMWQGMEVRGEGFWDHRLRKPWQVEAVVEGYPEVTGLPEPFAPLAEKKGRFNLSIVNEVKTGWTISTNGFLQVPEDTIKVSIDGTYTKDGYQLEAVLPSSEERDISLVLEARHNQPLHLQFSEPHLFAGWWRKDWKKFERYRRFQIAGEIDYMKKNVSGAVAISDLRTRLNLNLFGSVDIGEEAGLNAVASYNISRDFDFIGNGSFNLKYKDYIIYINQLLFRDYLTLDGAIDLKNHQFKNIELDLNDFDLSDILNRFTILHANKLGGKVNGKLFLSGGFKEPEIDANLEFYDGFYGDLKNYWGHLELVTTSEGNLAAQEGVFGRAETILLNLNGLYYISKDSLDLFIKSEGTEADIYLEAITGVENLVQGKILFDARVFGELRKPSWSMNIRGTNTKFAGISFREADILLEGKQAADNGQVLTIQRFSLTQPTLYTFQAEGTIPLKTGLGMINFHSEGRLFSILPQLSPLFLKTEGGGTFRGSIAFKDGKPSIKSVAFSLREGGFEMGDIFQKIESISADIKIDSSGTIKVERLDGIINGDAIFEITNSHHRRDIVIPPETAEIEFKKCGLNLGVLLFSTLTDKGFRFRIPGVMSNNEYGRLRITGKNGADWFLIGGPAENLHLNGSCEFSNARITFPPIAVNGKSKGAHTESFVETVMRNAAWDVNTSIRQDVWYIREIIGLEKAPLLQKLSGLFDRISIELSVEPTDPSRPIHVTGKIADNSFRLSGDVTSTKGSIEFLDLQFQMEKGELVFDSSDPLPIASGRAVTQLTDEATGFQRTIYFTLYMVDPRTGQKTTRGRWGEFTFELEDDRNSSQEEILASLGYTVGGLQDKFTSISGGMVSAMTHRWLRPIERDVARFLGLDMLQLKPTLAKNILNEQLFYRDELQTHPPDESFASRYLQASTVTVGKYLTRDLFLSYTGQLGRDEVIYGSATEQRKLGFLQKWSLEYRVRTISPSFV